MEIKTKYDINQYVMIPDISQSARVSKIIQDGKNLFYEVSYWWEGQLRFVTLDEDEIHAI